MPRIAYPNVPNVSGVPQVLRAFPAAPPAPLPTVVGVASLLRAFLVPSQWGIFKTKVEQNSRTETLPTGEVMFSPVVVTAREVPVVEPDSFLTFGFHQEWSITTAPVQQGAFADFNRVASPFEVQVRMTKGGTVAQRRTFLDQIEALSTTQLYDILTPEKRYLRCNFIRSEISRRQEKGAYQLSEVDVFFREIRVVESAYSRTSLVAPHAASAASMKNNGTVGAVTSSLPIPPSVTR